MKKTVFIFNVLLFITCVVTLITYDLHGGLLLKGLTSLNFVLLGAVNLIYGFKSKSSNKVFLILIFCGLVCGMLADVLLAVVFIMGILFFALGHIMYLISFYILEPFRLKELKLIIPLSVFSVFIVIGTPYIVIEDPLLQKLLIGYAIIIACMLSKSISNAKQNHSTYRILMLIGSAMFYFSDLILAIDMFGTPSRLTWILCSYNYWPAQCIIA